MEINPDFERDLACYTRMVNEINKHGIEFVGTDGLTVTFKKGDKTFSHALSTWQCVPDPTRPAFTEENVINMVLHAFGEKEITS